LPQKQNSSYCSLHKSALNESKLPTLIWVYSTRKKINIFLELLLVYL
jgi:hypothetical protein